MKKPVDDYHWPDYTEVYAKQTEEMKRDEKTDFLLLKSYVRDRRIIWEDNANVNWKQLYQTIIDLNVGETFECGCGPCYHLQNIKHLCPSVNVWGVELLQTQLDFGRNVIGVDPHIFECVDLADLSVPCASCLFDYKFEFVYTQAVTMHLKHEKAVEFIRNMANISRKYVFLMENWNNHDYPTLLEESGVLNVFSYEMIDGEYQRYLLLTK